LSVRLALPVGPSERALTGGPGNRGVPEARAVAAAALEPVGSHPADWEFSGDIGYAAACRCG